jgi:hypothetical protein
VCVPDAEDWQALPGSDEAFHARLREALPHYGSPDKRPIQFAEVYAELLATSAARAQWLGALLADQLAREGYTGLVGHRYGIDPEGGGEVALSEEARALVKLEAAERDRAERLAKDGIRMGIEAKKVDVLRAYARTIAEIAKATAMELGFNWSDPAVRRAAQRAVLAARQNLGESFTSPDRAGPRMTGEERQRALETGLPPVAL